MRVLDITDHLPLVMSYGVSLRVPYMKSLRGSLRVVLSCIIVLLLFYHKHTHPLGSHSRVTSWTYPRVT